MGVERCVHRSLLGGSRHEVRTHSVPVGGSDLLAGPRDARDRPGARASHGMRKVWWWRLLHGADPELRIRRRSCDRAGARNWRLARSGGARARNVGGADAKDTPREASVGGPRWGPVIGKAGRAFDGGSHGRQTPL